MKYVLVQPAYYTYNNQERIKLFQLYHQLTDGKSNTKEQSTFTSFSYIN